MPPPVVEIVAKVSSFEKLGTLERNIRDRDALSPEIELALRAKYAELGRALVADKTGVDLSELTPAEEKIVEAVALYAGLLKRDGKTATRTFQMIANRGLIEAAEVSVSNAKPTQGYEILEEAHLEELSFEQIIVDHPDEFSPRALWFARKTIGLPNESEKPPAADSLITQIRTRKLIDWWHEMVRARGKIGGYSNADVGRQLGFDDLAIHGRVLGNITSRIDFACYKCGLPPLGLCARSPFANAWSEEDRKWHFPVDQMATAAQTRNWTAADLDKVQTATTELPGTASISWKRELREAEPSVRRWAQSFGTPSNNFGSVSQYDIEEMQKAEEEAQAQTPMVRRKISRSIERGKIGRLVKEQNGFKCQICEAMESDPHSFKKKNGEPYVEAHHVVPVSKLQIGSLSATNIMTLCANHHRQMHYGDVSITIEDHTFDITIDGRCLRFPRHSFSRD